MKKTTFLLVATLCAASIFAQTTPITVFTGEDDVIHPRFRALSSQSLEIADNPLKDAQNGSDKVMLITPFIDPGLTAPGNRCILMIDMIRNMSGEDVIYTFGYTNIKMKYYSPNVRENQVIMQWNAATTYAPVSLYPAGGQWETLDFEFPYDDEDFSTFQIIFNENKAWYGPDFLMYIDDVEVYNKNESAIDGVNVSNWAANTYRKNGQTVLTLNSSEASIVSAELFSINGQKVQDLYRGTLSGAVEAPVCAEAGMYLARISDGNTTKTLKLIVR
jgi:hypothetical protein